MRTFNWTPPQEEWLRQNFNKCSYSQVIDHIGCTWSQLRYKLRLENLRKPADVRRLISLNNGIRVRFKANKPGVLKPIIKTNVRTTTRGAKRVWVKLGVNQWMPLAEYNLRKAGYAIPKKHVITYIDENPLNCEVENLNIISLTEHLALQYHKNKKAGKKVGRPSKYTPEQRAAILATKETKRKAREEKKATKERRKQKWLQMGLTPQQAIQEQRRQTLAQNRAKRKPKAPKEKPVKIDSRQPYKHLKRVEKTYQVKQVDTSQLIAVKMDNRTTMYVKPGTDIEKLKQKWQSPLQKLKLSA